jgi:hypothetical protein
LYIKKKRGKKLKPVIISDGLEDVSKRLKVQLRIRKVELRKLYVSSLGASSLSCFFANKTNRKTLCNFSIPFN